MAKPKPTKTSRRVLDLTEALSGAVSALEFAEPVACVYNPLEYAEAPHRAYVERFARKKKRVMFLGMNPGPFGMAQTGVPFGVVSAVRDWMGIEAEVRKPACQHEKRPVLGFACTRMEVSGERLWGLFAEKFGTAEAFFHEHYVANYCPLVFMEGSGRNRTPDKLPKAEREALAEACDEHLVGLVEALRPEEIVGVGKFAEKKALDVVGDKARITCMLHPSPASPLANQGWAPKARAQLVENGVW